MRVPHTSIRRSFAPLVVLMATVAVGAACVDKLPDQDRRIVEAHPIAKMSTTQLWKAYAADKAGSDRQYFGKAVDVTGKVWTVHAEAPASIMFVEQDPHGVQANLLDDQSAAILKDAAPGQRLTLRCYVSGLSGDVILKSCIKP